MMLLSVTLMFGLCYSNIPNESVGFNLFGINLSKIEKSLRETRIRVEKFWNTHKDAIEVGQFLLLHGAGFEEAGMAADLIELLKCGTVDEIIKNVGDILDIAETGHVFHNHSSIVRSLCKIEGLVESTVEVGRKIRDHIYSITDVFARPGSIFKKHPIIGTPILIKLAHLVATSNSTINTWHMSRLTMRNILLEYLIE